MRHGEEDEADHAGEKPPYRFGVFLTVDHRLFVPDRFSHALLDCDQLFDVRIKVTGTELNFVGLDHYRYALLQDAVFPTNLMESLFLIAAGLPIVMVFRW